MVDILIEFVTAAMSVGSITAAHMYAPDLITIEGITNGGKYFNLTFRHTEGSTNEAVKNP